MNKITIKNSVRIIDDKLVIKKKKRDLINLFNYLASRSFNYYPEIISDNGDSISFEYIKDIAEPNEQKINDLIVLLSLLHSKTTIYKEIDLDNYKALYEKILYKINDVYDFYNNLINSIDNDIYMSPANYLIARNSSIIFNALSFARDKLDRWYNTIKNKRKVRVVTLHNNVSMDHYLKNNKPYLISWDYSKIDMPIYDIIMLYKNHCLDYDFSSLLNIYFKKYPFYSDEMNLFLSLISIPNKINFTYNQYENVQIIRKEIDYLYKSNEIVLEFDLKEEGIEKETNK